ncbi:MAG: hypothetical protein QF391_16550, partial [Myxococcota bacterium]|nr:hypothetical protein [Myxococcota bacterium]
MLETLDGSSLVPAGADGEAGIALGRLLMVPPTSQLDLRLDDAPGGGGPPQLDDMKRRRLAKLVPGRRIAWLGEENRLELGEVRTNNAQRILFTCATFGRSAEGTWERLYLQADGAETRAPTATESLTEVAYEKVIGAVTLADDRLDPASRRLVAAAGAVEIEWAPAAPVLAVAEDVHANTDKVVPGVWATVEGKRVIVIPATLSDADRLLADDGEELFDLPARGCLRYAAYVAAETEKLAAANPLLGPADRAALVQVCVDRRVAIWLPGSAYSRVVGAKYDVDVGDANPITQHPYRKSPQEEAQAQWHINKGLKMGLLKTHVGP